MLASVQLISSVDPIQNADSIEVVSVLGWKCVVRKNQFHAGDLCVYIEIDTIVPKKYVDDSATEEDKHRLRTVKLRGQLSQGLVLPLPEGNYNLGDDVADLFEVCKYEKEIPVELRGMVRGDFPSFISKTDEERVQSNPEILKSLNGKPYYISIKIDGTSGTFFKLENELRVCSKKWEMKEGGSVYWNVASLYNLNKIIPEGISIQGEIAGPGIQGNKLGLKEVQLFIFNGYNFIEGRYFTLQELEDFCKWFGLNTVPIIEVEEEFNKTQEELLLMAEQVMYPNGSRAEGIVVRSIDKEISFKVLNNKFLLKHGE